MTPAARRTRWRCWRDFPCSRASALTPIPRSFPKCASTTAKVLREVDPRARSVMEYREAAGLDEGMNGLSTRFAFKVLAATFNHDTVEVAGRSRASYVCSGAGSAA